MIIARTLDTLLPQEPAIIARVEGSGQSRLRLMELGFVNGSQISLLSRTPFGDPHIYGIRGTAIALRKQDAKNIVIRSE